jgi:hypothetical protein
MFRLVWCFLGVSPFSYTFLTVCFLFCFTVFSVRLPYVSSTYPHLIVVKKLFVHFQFPNSLWLPPDSVSQIKALFMFLLSIWLTQIQAKIIRTLTNDRRYFLACVHKSNGSVHLAYNPSYLAYFFSRNSIFPAERGKWTYRFEVVICLVSFGASYLVFREKITSFSA